MTHTNDSKKQAQAQNWLKDEAQVQLRKAGKIPVSILADDRLAQHTPGPWQNNGGQIEAMGGLLLPGYRVIGTVGKVNEQTQRDTANARLIAAAPDLLAACRELVRYTQEPMSREQTEAIWNQCRSAIAKAEGRAE